VPRVPSQAQAAGQGAADEPPAAQPAPADPPAQNEAEPEPPDVPPDQADDPELEEEGAAAEDADPNNGAQGWNMIYNILTFGYILFSCILTYCLYNWYYSRHFPQWYNNVSKCCQYDSAHICLVLLRIRLMVRFW